jgi:hypothetical protein
MRFVFIVGIVRNMLKIITVRVLITNWLVGSLNKGTLIMETKEILHVLRNPYGHSEDYIREARLAACDLIEKVVKEPDEIVLYKDREPCKRKGCLQHVTHPCEWCGRTAGIGTVTLSNAVNWKMNLLEEGEANSYIMGFGVPVPPVDDDIPFTNITFVNPIKCYICGEEATCLGKFLSEVDTLGNRIYTTYPCCQEHKP